MLIVGHNMILASLGLSLRFVWANFFVMTKFTPLSKTHVAHVACERLLARVRILVLLLVLGKAECLHAVSTLYLFLAVVLLVVSLQREFGPESSVALIDITFEDCILLNFVGRSNFFVAQGDILLKERRFEGKDIDLQLKGILEGFLDVFGKGLLYKGLNLVSVARFFALRE